MARKPKSCDCIECKAKRIGKMLGMGGLAVAIFSGAWIIFGMIFSL